MAAKRAQVISMKELAKSIDRAVEVAKKRHGVLTDSQTLFVNWEIVGRILRDLRDMNAAFKVATDITSGVKVQGIKAQPACVKIGPDILVGFIEKAGIPKQIAF